ncbi:ATP-binding cassette domain-containing protein [Hymenobacter artigasi]|uniref:ABC-2 type transport system ATP-binding protein n=1 Tax=Hymenobacter artigasi TaxID=2719616 RepID=A0ABX1HM99_9BACT|nr:ABC transporter ATP-binding protein [Hymenobacter artigasi]NKI90116.1 ABC-2 type transport system ATP-binding protein [Hymenobacter artigasi]
MLQLTNFSKSYRGRAVLRIDSFAFASGTYWIQGANGSGKSTLLRAIAGITPFEGDILLAGQLSVKKQSVAYRRLVNFAEAEPVFPEFLTGRELIDLFRTAKNGPPHQEDFYLEGLHMTAYVHEPVGTYSSGMLKKLSLVLAFLGQPTCIVLDEPLTTLDAAAIPVLCTWMARQHAQQGTSFLLSSHQAFAAGALPAVQQLLIEHATLQHAG